MSNYCCLLQIMCQGLHLCTGNGDGRLSYDQSCRNGSKWDWNGTESFRTDHAEIELPKCAKDALGKSWSKIKWNGNSRYQISENSGIPLKVVLFSGNSTKCSIRSALFHTGNFWEFTPVWVFGRMESARYFSLCCKKLIVNLQSNYFMKFDNLLVVLFGVNMCNFWIVECSYKSKKKKRKKKRKEKKTEVNNNRSNSIKDKDTYGVFLCKNLSNLPCCLSNRQVQRFLVLRKGPRRWQKGYYWTIRSHLVKEETAQVVYHLILYCQRLQ